jgi:hypothetical protein
MHFVCFAAVAVIDALVIFILRTRHRRASLPVILFNFLCVGAVWELLVFVHFLPFWLTATAAGFAIMPVLACIASRRKKSPRTAGLK